MHIFAAVTDPAVAATEELLKLGVPGVVIIGLAFALYKTVVKREEDAKTHREELKEKDKIIAALQEARLNEAKSTMEGLTKASHAMVRQTEVQEDMVETWRTIAAEYSARRGRP